MKPITPERSAAMRAELKKQIQITETSMRDEERLGQSGSLVWREGCLFRAKQARDHRTALLVKLSELDRRERESQSAEVTA